MKNTYLQDIDGFSKSFVDGIQVFGEKIKEI